MKNNKLLWAFVIIMLTTCQMKTFGQLERVSSAPMPEPITKTIVRHYQNDDVVSYVRTTSKSYFTLSDAHTYNKIATIDPRYVVNDMEVYKGHVYFCGINTRINTGFIGFFRINNFFNGTDCYSIFDCIPYDATGGYVNDLNRLVVFKNNAGVNVAAIGHIDNYYNSSCIVDYLPMATTGNNYTVGFVPTTGLISDFLDITCTENYVVVSDLLKQMHIPTLRAFDINNLWAINGIQNYQYVFSEPIGNMVFNGDDLLIEHLYSDFVATATYWKDLTSSVMYDGTNISIFDINQMITSYAGMLGSFGIHQPFYAAFWKLYELRSNPVKKSLCLLQSTDDPNVSGRTVYMVNEFNRPILFPPGNVDCFYIPNNEFHSLDVFDSNIITSGTIFSDRYEEKFHLRKSFLLGICSIHTNYAFTNYNISKCKKEKSDLSIYSSMFYPLLLYPIIDENEPIVECPN